MQVIAISLFMVLGVAYYVFGTGEVTGSATVPAGEETDVDNPAENRPARDGNIAIRQEFDAAVEANTTEAFELFIARHPDHPLAALAKEKLDRLSFPDE